LIDRGNWRTGEKKEKDTTGGPRGRDVIGMGFV